MRRSLDWWIGDAPRPPGSLVVNTMPCSELMVGEVDNMGHDWLSQVSLGSMYGIFTYIYQENQPNVDKYTIHGWYGVCWPESTWWVWMINIYIYIYSHIWKIPESQKVPELFGDVWGFNNMELHDVYISGTNYNDEYRPRPPSGLGLKISCPDIWMSKETIILWLFFLKPLSRRFSGERIMPNTDMIQKSVTTCHEWKVEQKIWNLQIFRVFSFHPLPL